MCVKLKRNSGASAAEIYEKAFELVAQHCFNNGGGGYENLDDLKSVFIEEAIDKLQADTTEIEIKGPGRLYNVNTGMSNCV